MKKLIIVLCVLSLMAFTAERQTECDSRAIIKQLFFDANIYQPKKKLIAELKKDKRFSGGEITQEENPIMGDTYEVCTFTFKQYPFFDFPFSYASFQLENINKEYAENDLTLYFRFKNKNDFDKAMKIIQGKLNNSCFKKMANGNYVEASTKSKPAEIMIYSNYDESRGNYHLNVVLMYEY